MNGDNSGSKKTLEDAETRIVPKSAAPASAPSARQSPLPASAQSFVARPKTPPARTPDDGATRIIAPAQKASESEPEPERRAPAASRPVAIASADQERTVGWLVIVKGPGKGASLPIFYGKNTLGSKIGQKLRLGFGDEAIAPHAATLTFDHLNTRFFISDGSGDMPIYLNGEPVLSPREMNARDILSIGATQALFVPLCGDGFSWEEPK